MWQRKQTVFLLLAIAAIILSLLVPVAHLSPTVLGGAGSTVYNLGVVADGAYRFGLSSALALLLSLAGILAVAAIFTFKNRRLQMRLCSLSMLMLALWYVWLAVSILTSGSSQANLSLAFGSCLPLVAFILDWLARRGVKADEELIRSMDRIR